MRKVGSNPTPRRTGSFIALCVGLQRGLVQLASELNITQITAAQFQAQLAAFLAAQGAFDAARSAKQPTSDAYLPAVAATRDWLMTARNAFIKSFGTRWNTQWAQAGWSNNSTAIPVRQAAQLSLIQTVANFLSANPSYEVAALDVTAHDATSLLTAALLAQQANIDAGIAQKAAGATRDSALKTMRTTARMLINILNAVLAPNDPRWLAFGLNQPGVNTTPGKPDGVTAHVNVTGAIIVTCDAVPLATRYRWRMLLVGVQTEYVLAASSTEPMAMIRDGQPGQHGRLIVQGANGESQGVASEPIEFTMPGPPPRPPAPAAETPALDLTAVATNGH